MEAEAVEAVAEVFARWGHGVAIEEPLEPDQEPEEGPRTDSRAPVLVKTYLPDDGTSGVARQRIEEAVWHLGLLRRVEPVQVRRIAEDDWAHAWKQYFHVHRPGQRIVVVPSWRRYRATGSDVVVRLDPGMAFGTGLHPTTRLCLREMERCLAPGMRVLDLGTGSGILAIAAARLGASHVMALDVDATAVRVAQENVRRNRVARRVIVAQGTLPLSSDPCSHPVLARNGKKWLARGDGPPLAPPCEAGQADGRGLVSAGEVIVDGKTSVTARAQPSWSLYDLVVANISYRVLSQLHPEIFRVLAPGGCAIMSGVLERDGPGLVDQLEAGGWEVTGRSQEADWLALVARPRAAAAG